MRIAILGAGNMGCALATVLAANRHSVTLWSIESDVVADIREHHRTEKYLPGVALDAQHITATGDLAAACAGAVGVVVAVPSTVISRVVCAARPFIPHRIPVLSVAKGIDPEYFYPLPVAIASALGRTHDGVVGLAGPAVATEFAAGTPTAVVVVGSPAAARFWKRALTRPMFHVEESRDLVGVSWAATLKNVYAIALGMCDGMRYSANAKAILTTRSLAEMAAFLRSVRAKPETVYGLAGVGDLVTTGFSSNGRNREFGEMLCAGAQCDIAAVLKTMTVEGVAAVAVAHAWVQRKRLRLPLLELVYRVCHRGAIPCASLTKYLRS